MSEKDLTGLEEAAREQLISDVNAALVRLDTDYDSEVPTDRETAEEVVALMTDPAMMYFTQVGRMAEDQLDELWEMVEENYLIRVFFARQGIQQLLTGLSMPLVSPENPEPSSGGGPVL